MENAEISQPSAEEIAKEKILLDETDEGAVKDAPDATTAPGATTATDDAKEGLTPSVVPEVETEQQESLPRLEEFSMISNPTKSETEVVAEVSQADTADYSVLEPSSSEMVSPITSPTTDPVTPTVPESTELDVVTEKQETPSEDPVTMPDAESKEDGKAPEDNSAVHDDDDLPTNSSFDIIDQQEIDEEEEVPVPSENKEEVPAPSENKEEVPAPSQTEGDEVVKEETSAEPQWLNVLGNDQLKKRTTKYGKGENLEKGQQVTMVYSLMLPSGQTVDSEVQQTFQLGDGEVISAIELTCNLAKVGEIFEVVSASRFAYEVYGRHPLLPANASVLLTIEILQAEDTPKVEDMSEEHRIVIGDRKRKIGNDYFNRQDYANASKNYQRACMYLDPPSYSVKGEPSPALKELQFKSWCNLSISDLKLSNPDSGLRAANRALEIDPSSTKAMYRKGKLLVEKGELEQAEKILKKACQVDPKSQGCKQLLKEISSTIHNQKKKQQRMYKKMFSLGEDEEEKSSSSFRDSPWLQGAIPMVAGVVAVGALAAAAYSGIKMLQ